MKKGLVGLMFLAAIAAFSAIVMLLWNGLLPAIFGITAINFWQALGILVLSKILFSGFSFGRHLGPRRGHNHFRERWQKMSEEERRDFLKRHRHFDFEHDFFYTENGKNDEGQ